eukprot:s217_g12.t1
MHANAPSNPKSHLPAFEPATRQKDTQATATTRYEAAAAAAKTGSDWRKNSCVIETSRPSPAMGRPVLKRVDFSKRIRLAPAVSNQLEDVSNDSSEQIVPRVSLSSRSDLSGEVSASRRLDATFGSYQPFETENATVARSSYDIRDATLREPREP